MTRRCESCGYDVTQTIADGFDVCPECGASLRSGGHHPIPWTRLLAASVAFTSIAALTSVPAMITDPPISVASRISPLPMLVGKISFISTIIIVLLSSISVGAMAGWGLRRRADTLSIGLGLCALQLVVHLCVCVGCKWMVETLGWWWIESITPLLRVLSA